MRMEEDRRQMTKRILNLTLEIIYLLTGESFPPVKSGDHLTIMVPPCDSVKPERHKMQKILEVTQKMMELLTWESYSNADVKEEIKREDGAMVESSSYRKPPERCPRRDPIQEDGHHHQGGILTEVVVKEEYKEEDKVYGVMEEQSEGHKDLYKEITMELPERCPLPLYYIQDGHIYARHNRGENVMDMKVAGEESYVRDDQQYTEEEAGMRRTFIEEEEDMTGEKTMSSATDGGPHSVDRAWTPSDSQHHPTVQEDAGIQEDKPYSCFECGKCYPRKSSLVRHQKNHTGEKPFSCPQCGKCFIDKSKLVTHYRSHTGEKPYSCLECGKCFSRTHHLCKHQKSHTRAKLYTHLMCGGGFPDGSSVFNHKSLYTEEKRFPCLECGKCFSDKFSHSRHQRLHTGEKPYPCPECGRCFRHKHALVLHQRRHAGEKPYTCTVCGKCFVEISSLSRHQRIHNTFK